MPEPLIRSFGFPFARYGGWFDRYPDLGAAALFCLRRIAVWSERRRQRRVLAELNAHLLRDVGLSREEALREAAKPFWR